MVGGWGVATAVEAESSASTRMPSGVGSGPSSRGSVTSLDVKARAGYCAPSRLQVFWRLGSSVNILFWLFFSGVIGFVFSILWFFGSRRGFFSILWIFFFGPQQLRVGFLFSFRESRSDCFGVALAYSMHTGVQTSGSGQCMLVDYL